MKIHLIRTPEYEIERLDEVQELLDSFDGPLKFFLSSIEFTPGKFEFLGQPYFKNADGIKKLLYDISMQNALSWQQLFSLCDYYRSTFKVETNDFVVLLTDRKNVMNWFSHCDARRNIFVHTGDWETFTKAPQKFPVAYQVVENILQHLMKLDVEQIPNPNLHHEPLGCMNDFCQNKQQVILKLRTGDICYDCLLKMRLEKVDDEIINQSIGIFEAIRNQLLFKQGFTRNLTPKPVKIDSNGKIFIGDKLIDLNPLESTLFIFFITKKEGVSLNDLEKYRKQLLNIYQIIRPAGEAAKIDNLIKPKGTGTFPKNKSSLNKKLKEQIGEPLVNFYYLDGNRGDVFKIGISADFITSDIRH